MHTANEAQRVPTHSSSAWTTVHAPWRVALLLALVAVLAFEAPVAAQGSEVLIQQLSVQVMPEFDDPRVLVIVQGRVDPGAAGFPTTLAVRVPRGAQVNQMAELMVDTGATAPQPYDVQPDLEDDSWTIVTYAVSSAHFFYEYYYLPYAPEATDKAFKFTFRSPVAVNDLRIEVQQPLKATAFTLDPLPSVARQDDALGFTYHQYVLGDLAAGENVAIDVAYTKIDPNPSVAREQMAGLSTAPAPMPPTAAQSESVSSATGPGVPWGWIGLGVAAIAAAGYVGWLAGRRTPGARSAPQPTRRPELHSAEARAIPIPPSGDDVATVREEHEDGSASADVRFCVTCGAQLKANARFCHVCGAQAAS